MSADGTDGNQYTFEYSVSVSPPLDCSTSLTLNYLSSSGPTPPPPGSYPATITFDPIVGVAPGSVTITVGGAGGDVIGAQFKIVVGGINYEVNYILATANGDCADVITLQVEPTSTNAPPGTYPNVLVLTPGPAAQGSGGNPACTGNTSLTWNGNYYYGTGYVNGGLVYFEIYGNTLPGLILVIGTTQYAPDSTSTCELVTWTISSGINGCVPIVFSLINGLCGSSSSSSSSSTCNICNYPPQICMHYQSQGVTAIPCSYCGANTPANTFNYSQPMGESEPTLCQPFFTIGKNGLQSVGTCQWSGQLSIGLNSYFVYITVQPNGSAVMAWQITTIGTPTNCDLCSPTTPQTWDAFFPNNAFSASLQPSFTALNTHTIQLTGSQCSWQGGFTGSGGETYSLSLQVTGSVGAVKTVLTVTNTQTNQTYTFSNHVGSASCTAQATLNSDDGIAAAPVITPAGGQGLVGGYTWYCSDFNCTTGGLFTLTDITGNNPCTGFVIGTTQLQVIAPSIDTLCNGQVCMTQAQECGSWSAFGVDVGGLSATFILTVNNPATDSTLYVNGTTYYAGAQSTCGALYFLIPQLGTCTDLVCTFTGDSNCCFSSSSSSSSTGVCPSGTYLWQQTVNANSLEGFSLPAGSYAMGLVEVWGRGGATGVGVTPNGPGGGGGGAYAASYLPINSGSSLTTEFDTTGGPGSVLGTGMVVDSNTVFAPNGNDASLAVGAAGGSAADCIGTTAYSGGSGGNGGNSGGGTEGGGGGGGASGGPFGPGQNGQDGGTVIGGAGGQVGPNAGLNNAGAGGMGGTGGTGGQPGQVPGGGGNEGGVGQIRITICVPIGS